MAEFEILVLPGDGIGPEVTAEGVRALEAIGARFGHDFRTSEELVGGACIDTHGIAILTETIEVAVDCTPAMAATPRARQPRKTPNPRSARAPWRSSRNANRSATGGTASSRCARPPCGWCARTSRPDGSRA